MKATAPLAMILLLASGLACQKVEEAERPKKPAAVEVKAAEPKPVRYDPQKEMRSLALKGDVNAQIQMGECYTHGHGVIQDYQEAMKWFRMAAESGDARAQYRLGRCYHEGKLVIRNEAEAFKWYRVAAEQGEPSAQFELGEKYRSGTGVEKDMLLAHMWYNLASARGMNQAGYRRDALAAEMSQVQIFEAQKMAREWRPRPPAPPAEKLAP
ncbi:MAG: sel1 repeat family protein [Deltaproteobacteria bacterium]|nr:sel1 repeat family protein [Deltaproteobacteria bacterium]